MFHTKNNAQGTKEFCGRCVAMPLVKLATETYSPPDFPPKLKWYKFQSQKDCTGSVLAAFELIEVSYPSFLPWAIYQGKYRLHSFLISNMYITYIMHVYYLGTVTSYFVVYAIHPIEFSSDLKKKKGILS